MFRLIPNIFGGYDVMPVAGEGLMAGAGIFLAGMVLFVGLANAILYDVLIFSAAIVCILIGFLIIFCCSGSGTPRFLSAVAPFFFYYALISLCSGIYENALHDHDFGLFAVIGILFVFVIGGFMVVGACSAACDEFDKGGQSFIFYMVLVLGSLFGLFGKKYIDSWCYVFRVIGLVCLVFSVINFFRWIKNKGNTEGFGGQMTNNLIYLALGIVPIILIAVLGGLAYSSVGAWVLLIAVCAIYVVAAIYILKQKERGENGNVQFVFVPYLIINTALVAQQGQMNISSEVVGFVMSLLQNSHLMHFLAGVCEKSNAMFANAVAPVLNFVLSLVLRIFDSSMPYFDLPPAAGAILGLAIIHFVMSYGASIYMKQQAKKKSV